MDEIEVPTEHLHEAIHEKVEGALNPEHKEKGWFLFVAISTALMAVFAAVSSLLAGHHSNEALLEQIKASDQWSYYQAKGIKAEIKTIALNYKQASPGDVDRYKKEQEDIKITAEELQRSSNLHIGSEKIFAAAVTFFQIAIAIAAIAILSRKKFMWIASLIIGCAGFCFFIYAVLTSHF
jgi:hypothetical protein